MFSLIMKIDLMPSLEHMALVKIVVSLWNQTDVKVLILKLRYFDPCPSQWKKVEERVIQNVSQLSLPELLKEKVFGIIKPIGIEIFEWMQYYRKYNGKIPLKFHCLEFNFPAHLLAKLCWTPQGTVDRKRIAEVLVRDENLDVYRRYILACNNCLEDDIIQFWNRLPQDRKDCDWCNFPVIKFWSDNLKRGGAGHISYKDIFFLSMRKRNKVAAKYFLQKLTLQEREECLKKLAIYVVDADVLCFLLPEMKEEEQNEVLKNMPYRVLQCFLRWPWQSFFIGVANCMWDFLSRNIYDAILKDIDHKVKDDCKDYNYQHLFREFWQKSPNALKDSFFDKIENSWILQCLFDVKDKENIRLILKDATLKAKEKLIYSNRIGWYFTRYIYDNEWDFLEFCIRECLPSKNEMLKFKEEYEKSMYFKEYCSETEKQEWDQLFRFSDDSNCQYDKRSVEEGECSSSKRFQNLQ